MIQFLIKFRLIQKYACGIFSFWFFVVVMRMAMSMSVIMLMFVIMIVVVVVVVIVIVANMTMLDIVIMAMIVIMSMVVIVIVRVAMIMSMSMTMTATFTLSMTVVSILVVVVFMAVIVTATFTMSVIMAIIFCGGFVRIGFFVQPALHIGGLRFWIIETGTEQAGRLDFAVQHAEAISTWIDLVQAFIQRRNRGGISNVCLCNKQPIGDGGLAHRFFVIIQCLITCRGVNGCDHGI